MNLSVIQAMIAAIDKPAIFIGPDYRILAVNQAYQDTYSLSVQAGSSRCHQISHGSEQPCDKHGEDCPMQVCQQTGRSTRVVHVHETGKGRQYCNILMRPVKDEAGMTLGFLEVLDKVEFASSEVKDNKMIGNSQSFRQMLNSINRCAVSDISVLLQGETGTGKELVARAIHDASHRAGRPFVIIECTGLNESLFESELFGYEKGAFTGATSSKKGLIEVAHGGTVFFDEIGDVPLNLQVKLLRLLETRSFRAVGGLHPKQSDFRLVCATHKDLLEMVEAGQFRQDLFYRIAGFTVRLPPLRERAEDIPLLVQQFLESVGQRHKHFTPAAMGAICQHNFPGNIRELKSLVEQACLMTEEDGIHLEDLPTHVSRRLPSPSATDNDWTTLEKVEGEYLSRACQTFPGTLDELAERMGVSPRTLYRKMQKHGLKLAREKNRISVQ